MAEQRGRRQPQDLRGRRLIRPTAQPVNQLARPGRNDLQRLGEALSQFNPRLTRFASVIGQEQIEDDLERGASLVGPEEAEAFAEGQDVSELLPNENPAAIRGAKRRIAALMANREFLENSQKLQEAKVGSDPDEILGFLHEQHQSRMSLMDDEMLEAYRNKVEKHDAQLIAEHRARQAAQFETQQKDLFGRTVAQEIDQTDDLIIPDDPSNVSPEDLKGTPVGGLIDRLEAELDAAIEDGMSKGEANRVFADAIITTAEEELDEDVLVLLDMIDTGQGPIGNISDIRARKNNAALRIERRLRSQESRDFMKRERERKEQTQKVVDLYYQRVRGGEATHNPEDDIFEVVPELEDAPFEAVGAVRGIRGDLLDASTTAQRHAVNERELTRRVNHDPEAFAEIAEQIDRQGPGFSLETISQKRQAGVITGDEAVRLTDRYRDAERSFIVTPEGQIRDEGLQILLNQQFPSQLEALFDTHLGRNVYSGADLNSQYATSKRAVLNGLHEFVRNNPNMPKPELKNAIKEEAQRLIDEQHLSVQTELEQQRRRQTFDVQLPSGKVPNKPDERFSVNLRAASDERLEQWKQEYIENGTGRLRAIQDFLGLTLNELKLQLAAELNRREQEAASVSVEDRKGSIRNFSTPSDPNEPLLFAVPTTSE